MNFSGKVARNAAVAALGLMVMTFFTLDDPVLIALAGAVALVYAASVWSVLSHRRHVVMVLGAAGTALAVAFALAFLRTLGLAIDKDAEALGAGVVSRDADIYFYLAALTGLLTLAILFVAALWPARASQAPHPPRSAPARKPSVSRTAARNPVPKTSTPGKPAPRKPSGSVSSRKPQARKPASTRSR